MTGLISFQQILESGCESWAGQRLRTRPFSEALSVPSILASELLMLITITIEAEGA